jgi:hypothetical protein
MGFVIVITFYMGFVTVIIFYMGFVIVIIFHMADHTTVKGKRTNNDLHNTTQKTMD